MRGALPPMRVARLVPVHALPLYCATVLPVYAQAELADRYYARIAAEPTRHEITAGDTLYVPQNTVAQHFSADGTPLRLLSGQNRVFKLLGYDRVAYLEDAPRPAARASAAPAAPAAPVTP